MICKRRIDGIIFAYNLETGKVFRWWPKLRKWKVTGKALNPDGYHKFTFKGTQYLVHRFIFLIMTGSWPKDQVDHLNGNRADNSWCNLRDTTAKENALNVNKSWLTNYTGIYAMSNGRYKITLRRQTLGYKDTIEEAIEFRNSYLEITN